MTTDAPGPDIVEKLTITITHPENDIKNATLKVAWGHLALSAPVTVNLAHFYFTE